MGDRQWSTLVWAVATFSALGWTAGLLAHLVVRRYCDAPRRSVQWLCAGGCGLAALSSTWPALLVAIAVTLWCVCLSVIDMHTMRLPNPLTGLGAVGVAGLSVAVGRWQAAAVGAGLLAGLYLCARLCGRGLGREGFGGGDVKLAVGLGGITAMAGGQVWIVSALGALVLTILAGLWRVCRPGGRGRVVPHGPSMCLASLISMAALA